MTVTLADLSRIGDAVGNPRSDRPSRRAFTAEYEASILAEYCAERDERGATRAATACTPRTSWSHPAC